MSTTIDLRDLPELRAGDSLAWSVSLSNYPADDGWTLTMKLVGSAGAIEFSADPSGSSHAFSVGTSTTAAWSPGFYDWSLYVSKDEERFTLEDGSITILSNPAAESATDKRSHARKVLDAIRAVLEGRASKDQESYSINGRTLNRTPIKDLMELERVYAARVAQEERSQKAERGLGTTSKIRVRF